MKPETIGFAIPTLIKRTPERRRVNRLALRITTAVDAWVLKAERFVLLGG
jgi:hypothetical protein